MDVNRKWTFWTVVWFKRFGKSSLQEQRNLASRHIKREKASLSADVRRSKTSLLKVANT